MPSAIRWVLSIVLFSVSVFAVMPEGRAADWYIPTTKQAADPRIPLLKVQNNGRGSRGSAVLIAVDDQCGWYITNHHMTPGGASAKYTLVTTYGSIPAEFVKHDYELDLGLLTAEKPPANVKPLKVAKTMPMRGTMCGIHGWTHGKVFGYQEGQLIGVGNNGWCRIGVGANQGQSGGAFICDGKVIGITSRTDRRTTSGANLMGVRHFLGWE